MLENAEPVSAGDQLFSSNNHSFNSFAAYHYLASCLGQSFHVSLGSNRLLASEERDKESRKEILDAIGDPTAEDPNDLFEHLRQLNLSISNSLSPAAVKVFNDFTANIHQTALAEDSSKLLSNFKEGFLHGFLYDSNNQAEYVGVDMYHIAGHTCHNQEWNIYGNLNYNDQGRGLSESADTVSTWKAGESSGESGDYGKCSKDFDGFNNKSRSHTAGDLASGINYKDEDGNTQSCYGNNGDVFFTGWKKHGSSDDQKKYADFTNNQGTYNTAKAWLIKELIKEGSTERDINKMSLKDLETAYATKSGAASSSDQAPVSSSDFNDALNKLTTSINSSSKDSAAATVSLDSSVDGFEKSSSKTKSFLRNKDSVFCADKHVVWYGAANCIIDGLNNIDAFISAMNEKYEGLGLTRSVFNPSAGSKDWIQDEANAKFNSGDFCGWLQDVKTTPTDHYIPEDNSDTLFGFMDSLYDAGKTTNGQSDNNEDWDVSWATATNMMRQDLTAGTSGDTGSENSYVRVYDHSSIANTYKIKYGYRPFAKGMSGAGCGGSWGSSGGSKTNSAAFESGGNIVCDDTILGSLLEKINGDLIQNPYANESYYDPKKFGAKSLSISEGGATLDKSFGGSGQPGSDRFIDTFFKTDDPAEYDTGDSMRSAADEDIGCGLFDRKRGIGGTHWCEPSAKYDLWNPKSKTVVDGAFDGIQLLNESDLFQDNFGDYVGTQDYEANSVSVFGQIAMVRKMYDQEEVAHAGVVYGRFRDSVSKSLPTMDYIAMLKSGQEVQNILVENSGIGDDGFIVE